jgi:uncharacterized protein YbaR (Trm112 family)
MFRLLIGPWSSHHLTALSRMVPIISRAADSIYISVCKPAGPTKISSPAIPDFASFVKLLQSPISGEPLVWDKEAGLLIAASGSHFFPIHDEIPVLLPGAAQTR